jgi:hypothetical protein
MRILTALEFNVINVETRAMIKGRADVPNIYVLNITDNKGALFANLERLGLN